eukprot:PITA_33090
MKVLSYNCRGFASSPKKLALGRLLTLSQSDIIFLQEILCPADPLVQSLNSWMPNWTFHALDATGRSGGLAIGIHNRAIKIRNIWGDRGFIGLDVYVLSMEMDIQVINVYGPCSNRATFWSALLESELLKEDNIILDGDLNFTMGFCESWRHSAQVDIFSDTISNLLEEHHWVDIPTARLQHTWTNNRSGVHSLASRLDRFLIKESLYNRLSRIRQWVGSGGISDHRPIFLETVDINNKIKSPFKFNSSWLKDPSYIQLVTDYWQNNPIRDHENLTEGFIRKLTKLKRISKHWAHQKRIRDDQTLKEAERIITSYDDSSDGIFPNQESKEHYTSLVTKRSQILKEREESWRLRSRAIWLIEGDDNTKLYHKFANGRKAINTIWELRDEQNQIITSQRNLARLATDHFKGIYRAPREANILEIMRVVEKFPRFVLQEDSDELTKEVTMKELEATIKWFKKDRSPGPDRWIIESYIAFLDLLGNDLLNIIEHCRRNGRISSAIKSTFIALIPKANHPISFNDYRPISLCNCLYKIIAKIIANRLKPILSRHISPKQFAFLNHRQIHEAIATAQELLHSLHIKKQKGMILKVDLSKAFDRANWLYIRLLLTHLGFPYSYIKWIMSCITDVSYNVLLNGEATSLFTSERGLRQGCPLSPLLFLLIMEGLSRLITSARDRNQIIGINISDNFYLTHLLFVDDILIFLNGCIGDTTTLQNIFALFQQATGMMINESKSTITAVGCSQHESTYASHRFPFISLNLADGIKYLGYRLKPLGYRIADWTWLITKVEKRLQVWYHRYLSRADYKTLFLWKGHHTGKQFAWVKWDTIARPKRWGGWGIKNLNFFAKALAAKLGWNLLTTDSLWSRVAQVKYIKPSHLMDWFRQQHDPGRNISNIWKVVLQSLPLLREGITWRIKEGNNVRIGVDPWVGCSNLHRLSDGLLRHLHNRGIMHIKHIGDSANSTFLQQAWATPRTLEIPEQWHQEWRDFTDALTQAHIRLTEGPDEIIWAIANHGIYSPRLGYLKLMESFKPPNILPIWKDLWKLGAAPRTRLLMWNILFDKIPTETNLMKQSFHGPFRCHLCCLEEESTEHLFLKCHVTKDFWQNISTHYPSLKDWQGPNIMEAWSGWCREHSGKSIHLPLLVCWAIWIARNQIIFQNKAPHWPIILSHTIADYDLLPEVVPKNPIRTNKPISLDKSKPWTFFDGSAQEAGCGGGALLYLNDDHYYKIQIKLGRGTNNFAELNTTKHIIHFAIQKQCSHLQLFGDSQIVCNWLNDASHCYAFSLRHILEETKRLITSFESFICSHIYREHNTDADQLSKEAAQNQRDDWLIQEVIDGTSHQHYHKPFHDIF